MPTNDPMVRLAYQESILAAARYNGRATKRVSGKPAYESVMASNDAMADWRTC